MAELEAQLRAPRAWPGPFGPPAPLDYAGSVCPLPVEAPPRGSWRELYPPWVLVLFAVFVGLMVMFFSAALVTGSRR